MENINWLEKSIGKSSCRPKDADIYLGKTAKKATLTFYNECFKKITNDLSIRVGIGVNKIYLTDGVGYSGYKVGKQGGCNSYRIMFNYKPTGNEIGHYKLQQSKEDPDIFYIDLSQKIQPI